MRKGLLAIVATAAMLVTMIPAMAFAEEAAVITVDSNKTLTQAIAEANDLQNVNTVTIKINGVAEYDSATEDLIGSYSTINFVGEGENAEIRITRNGSNGYISGNNQGNDCEVNFNNLILSKPNGNYANDAGFMNVYFTVYRTGEVTYTNCTFPDGACAAGVDTTYVNCDFANQTSGEYSLWVYDNTNCVVKDSEFTGVRGVKMYIEHGGNSEAVANNSLALDNVNFSDSVQQKPAIVLTYGASVELNNNTYPTKGVFELDADGAPDGTAVKGNDMDEITCINDDGSCGAFVGNSTDGYKIYTTAEDAAKEAEKGDTLVILAAGENTDLADIPEGVAVENKSDNDITVNGETVAAGETYGEADTPSEAPSDTPSAGGQGSADKQEPADAVDTGDNSNTALFGGIALLSMAAAGATVFTRRREK